jgi:hypothetical protein
MSSMEEQEMIAHQGELAADVQNLLEKYRSIFAWDIPELDVAQADRLILAALREALSAVEMRISA